MSIYVPTEIADEPQKMMCCLWMVINVLLQLTSDTWNTFRIRIDFFTTWDFNQKLILKGMCFKSFSLRWQFAIQFLTSKLFPELQFPSLPLWHVFQICWKYFATLMAKNILANTNEIEPLWNPGSFCEICTELLFFLYCPSLRHFFSVIHKENLCHLLGSWYTGIISFQDLSWWP